MRRTRVCLILLLSFVALLGFGQETVGSKVHILQSGETIYTLAGEYGVPADVILRFNSITDPTRLPVGAQIRIPGTYVVAEGEYIYSIARKLGLDWQELLRANGLRESAVLRPGDVLLVPLQQPVDAAADTGTADDSASGDETAGAESLPAGTGGTDQATSDVASGSLLWPHPGQREAWDGRFRGVVMSGEAGDVFRSVTSGVVSFVGPFTSFGKLILVRAENGYLYGYAGADRVDVQQGDRISNGTILGSVGVSPAFQSARVLFTVWRNNRYVDPESAPRG